MIPISYTLNKYLNENETIKNYFNVTGCTEYPAKDFRVLEYVSFPFYILNNETYKELARDVKLLLGHTYTKKKYMIECLKMIDSIFKDMKDKDGNQFFRLYKFEDLKNNIKKITKNNCNLVLTDNKINSQNILGRTINETSFKDNDPVGILTDCYNIRKYFDCRIKIDNSPEKPGDCRKVQFAHTALRLIYCNNYNIMLYALTLYKKYKISAYYALWLAYNLKYSCNSDNSNYGDLFKFNDSFSTEKIFGKRFEDKKLIYSVQSHFDSEKSEFYEYTKNKFKNKIFESNKSITEFITGHNNFSHELIIKSLSKLDLSDKIKDLYNKGKESIEDIDEKVNFKFNDQLFNSTIVNVKYKGIIIRGEKLNRIIFKDENEIVLSVLQNSKFIQII